MYTVLLFLVILISTAGCRHVPRYNDLDEDEQVLFRAAYESPAYEAEEYQEENDVPTGKLDLLKDGMWAIKAKIKELKIINKALASNLLSTKLQVKEMLAEQFKPPKTQHYVEVAKKKPAYGYQSSPAYPVYSQYEQIQYAPPPAPPAHYGAPQYVSGAPPPLPPPPHYAEPTPHYGPPQYTHDPYYGN